MLYTPIHCPANTQHISTFGHTRNQCFDSMLFSQFIQFSEYKVTDAVDDFPRHCLWENCLKSRDSPIEGKLDGLMRRSVCAVVIGALGILCTRGWTYADSDDSAANKKHEVRAADSSRTSAGFTDGDSVSARDENNLSLTANKHRPRTGKDPHQGRRPAGDRWIQERA